MWKTDREEKNISRVASLLLTKGVNISLLNEVGIAASPRAPRGRKRMRSSPIQGLKCKNGEEAE